MKHRIHFDRVPTHDFEGLVRGFKKNDLASPTRSSVPLLSLFKHGGPMMDDMLAQLSVPNDACLHLEFTVRPPSGKGKASHTDLMMRYGSSAIAIESKWTEKPYDSVTKWLRKGTDLENKRSVLNGWLRLLQPHAKRELRAEDFGDAVYQTVHRAASACFEAATPRLVYLFFFLRSEGIPPDAENYRADLVRLRDLMGRPPDFKFSCMFIGLSPTEAFSRIKNLPKGEEVTASAVKQALLGAPLFEFGPLRHQPIH